MSRVCNATMDDLDTVKSLCFPDLAPNEYPGIFSADVPEESRVLWDVHQVLRYHLAWLEQENTPEARKWPEQMQVRFDAPLQTSKETLPMICKEIRE